MLVRGAIHIYHDHLTALAQRWPQPPQERVRLGHLVVHMDHEYPVEAARGQARVVFGAELDRDVVEPVFLDAAAEPAEGVLVDVLRQHALRRLGSRVEEDRLRSEEHTSELQSQSNLVCRLLLEKKK